MATAYDNLPMPDASQYPYNLQGDQTAVRQLTQAAQAGDSGALQSLRTLGLNASGGVQYSPPPASSSSSSSAITTPQLPPQRPVPPISPRPTMGRGAVPAPAAPFIRDSYIPDALAAPRSYDVAPSKPYSPPQPPQRPVPPINPKQTPPAAAPNYSAARNPGAPDPYRAQDPFMDPKTQLQRDRFELDKSKFENAKANYDNQQQAAAERINAQAAGMQSSRPTPPPMPMSPGVGGGGGGNPAIDGRGIKKTTPAPPKPAKGGGGGGGGGGKAGKNSQQMAREQIAKDKAKERAKTSADKRYNDKSSQGRSNSKGIAYRDRKDEDAQDAAEKRKRDNEYKAETEKTKQDAQKKANRERVAKENEERKKAVQAEKENPTSKPTAEGQPGVGPAHRMTHAYGNKNARMVKARGDFA